MKLTILAAALLFAGSAMAEDGSEPSLSGGGDLTMSGYYHAAPYTVCCEIIPGTATVSCLNDTDKTTLKQRPTCLNGNVVWPARIENGGFTCYEADRPKTTWTQRLGEWLRGVAGAK